MNIKKVKDFFYPAIELNYLYWAIFSVSAYISFYSVFSIAILREITHSIENKDIESITNFWLLYLFLTISFIILRVFTKNFEYWYPTFQVKQVLFKKYITNFILLNNNKAESLWTWKFIAIISSWIDIWSWMIHYIFQVGTSTILTVIFSIYFVYTTTPQFTIYFILFFTLLFWIIYFFNEKVRPIRNMRRDVKNDSINYLVRIIMSKFEVLQNKKIWDEVEHLNAITDKEIYYQELMMHPIAYMYYLPRLLIELLKIGTIFFIWIWVVHWIFTFWDFVALSWLTIILDNTFHQFLEFYKNFTREITYIEKIFDIYDTIPQIKWYTEGKDFEYKHGTYKIDNISFSYDGYKIFKNFSLKIKWWVKTAIVWYSWVWKSTLIKLIAWYLRPQRWDVYIDSQKFSTINLKSYYENIWYLTQEPSVFDGSIYDNLTYWIDREVDETELNIVIKKAECEFISDFKKWLQTEIWERWIRLSWWQKQRLAIAKILLKNPKIVILDEPTSSLDSFYEEKITNALQNLFVWRTVIIIAHRLQTVKDADRIIVLWKNCILQDGTHKDLSKQDGTYKQMLKLQSWVL